MVLAFLTRPNNQGQGTVTNFLFRCRRTQKLLQNELRSLLVSLPTSHFSVKATFDKATACANRLVSFHIPKRCRQPNRGELVLRCPLSAAESPRTPDCLTSEMQWHVYLVFEPTSFDIRFLTLGWTVMKPVEESMVKR